MADQLPAFRISHDEWLRLAYGKEIHKSHFSDCCDRINELVWSQIEQFAKFGLDVVLEGWGDRAQRNEARTQLARLGLEFRFYLVDCPKEIRLERVLRRNSNLGREGFFITEKDFNRMEEIDDVFGHDEPFIRIDNSAVGGVSD